MVLCQLDLAKADIHHERKRRQGLGIRRNQILQVVKDTVGLDTMLEVFQNEQEVAGKLQFIEEEGVEQIMQGGRQMVVYVDFYRLELDKWDC